MAPTTTQTATARQPALDLLPVLVDVGLVPAEAPLLVAVYADHQRYGRRMGVDRDTQRTHGIGCTHDPERTMRNFEKQIAAGDLAADIAGTSGRHLTLATCHWGPATGPELDPSRPPVILEPDEYAAATWLRRVAALATAPETDGEVQDLVGNLAWTAAQPAPETDNPTMAAAIERLCGQVQARLTELRGTMGYLRARGDAYRAGARARLAAATPGTTGVNEREAALLPLAPPTGSTSTGTNGREGCLWVLVESWLDASESPLRWAEDVVATTRLGRDVTIARVPAPLVWAAQAWDLPFPVAVDAGQPLELLCDAVALGEENQLPAMVAALTAARTR